MPAVLLHFFKSTFSVVQILSDPEQPQDNTTNNSVIIEGVLVDHAFCRLLVRVILPC